MHIHRHPGFASWEFGCQSLRPLCLRPQLVPIHSHFCQEYHIWGVVQQILVQMGLPIISTCEGYLPGLNQEYTKVFCRFLIQRSSKSGLGVNSLGGGGYQVWEEVAGRVGVLRDCVVLGVCSGVAFCVVLY